MFLCVTTPVSAVQCLKLSSWLSCNQQVTSQTNTQTLYIPTAHTLDCLFETVCAYVFLLQAMAAAFYESKTGKCALEAAGAAYEGTQRQTDSLVTTQ